MRLNKLIRLYLKKEAKVTRDECCKLVQLQLIM
jgi:hypothetical protein